MIYNLTFSEKNKGWTSFISWNANLMCRLNNQFFTVKDGQLYKHHDRDNPVTNTFYGTKYPSTITTIINEAPSEDKVFKNIIQEGSSPWETTIETNLSSGTIKASEFLQKESKWMAYMRKSESDGLLGRVQGIGNILFVSGNELLFDQIPTLVSIGETLYQLNNDVQEEIGVIQDIDVVAKTITIQALTNSPLLGEFAYSVKNNRIQGAEIRGYYAKVKLENDDDENSELFAIGSNIIKSYVPTDYK